MIKKLANRFSVAVVVVISVICLLILVATPAGAVQLSRQIYPNNSSSFDFVKFSGNPVLNIISPPHDTKGIRQANILNVFNPDYNISYKDNGKYYLFYDSCGGIDTDIWLPAMATSTNLINWTKQGLTNIIPTPSNYWEGVDTSAVTVIKYNGVYYMYYMGAPSDTGSPNHIPGAPNSMGLATTNTIDNIGSWVKYSNNPVLGIGSSETWDSTFVLTGSVLRDPTSARWMMFYAGYNGVIEQAGIAYSTDLISWTKYSGNPITTVQNGDCPRVFKANDGHYYMITNHTTYAYTDSLELHRNTNAELTSWEYLGVILNHSVSGWDSGAIGIAAPVYENGALNFLYDAGIDTGHMNRQIGLAQGAFPPTQVKLLGHDDIPILGGNGPNTITMQKFTAVGTGSVTEMRFHAPANTTGNVAIGIYADSNGLPTTLLGQKVVTVPSDANRVVIATLDSPIAITSGTVYWVAFNSSAALVGYNIESSVRKWKTRSVCSSVEPVPLAKFITALLK